MSPARGGKRIWIWNTVSEGEETGSEEGTVLRKEGKTAYASAKELVNVKKINRKKGRVDMCQALEEMIEDGKKEGQNRINSLNLKLTQDGRLDDLVKSCQDMEFQEQLLKEYNL